MIPVLTEEQRVEARDVAMRARRARAALKNDVASGKYSPYEALVLAKADDVLAHIPVIDLVRSVPGIGQRKADLVMEQANISPSRRIRGVGRHQLAKLKELLG